VPDHSPTSFEQPEPDTEAAKLQKENHQLREQVDLLKVKVSQLTERINGIMTIIGTMQLEGLF
jgi:uncharacterized protein YlxW (UPF0749 family)